MKLTLIHLCALAILARQAVAQQSTPSTGLLGVAFSSPRAVAGDNIKLRIRLTRRAPAGGFPIALKSSSTGLRLPKVITIPAGASAISLTVHVSANAKPQATRLEASEFISASKDMMSASHRRAAVLNISGPPALEGGVK